MSEGSHRLPLALAALAVAALIGVAATFAVVATGHGDEDGETVILAPGIGMMDGSGASGPIGPGMMGGAQGTQGEAAPVPSMEQAADQVESWLSDAGFDGFAVEEVMAFSNGYYVAVQDGEGRGAFELLVDPATGWVSPEPGPNMMWNTQYGVMGGHLSAWMGGGMMDGGSPDGPAPAPGATLSSDEARTLADGWLAQTLPGETAGSSHAFPGYVTFDTERDGRVQGMLSVNSRKGTVWYHVWHGSFVGELEA